MDWVQQRIETSEAFIPGYLHVVDRVTEIAALANKAAYNADHVQEYIDRSPHIKNESLRRLYAEQVVKILDFVSAPGKTVRVLDLGSGEGSVTLPRERK